MSVVATSLPSAVPVKMEADKSKAGLELAQLKRDLRLKTQLLKDQKQSIERYAKKISEKEKLLGQKDQSIQRLYQEHEAMKQLTETLRAQLAQQQTAVAPAVEAKSNTNTSQSAAASTPAAAKGVSENDEILHDDDEAPTGNKIEQEIEWRVAARLASERSKWEAEARASGKGAAASEPLTAAEKALMRYQENIKSVEVKANDSIDRSKKGSDQEHVQSLLVEMQQGRLHSSHKKLLQKLHSELLSVKNAYQEARHEVLTLKAAVKKIESVRVEAQQVTDQHKTQTLQLKAKVDQLYVYFKKV